MTAAEVLNLKISTHAPRVRRDNVCKVRLLLNHQDFYSRASCEARLGVGRNTRIWCISTHAPRVRRDIDEAQEYTDDQISTHAPRVRRDETWSPGRL